MFPSTLINSEEFGEDSVTPHMGALSDNVHPDTVLIQKLNACPGGGCGGSGGKGSNIYCRRSISWRSTTLPAPRAECNLFGAYNHFISCAAYNKSTFGRDEQSPLQRLKSCRWTSIRVERWTHHERCILGRRLIIHFM